MSNPELKSRWGLRPCPECGEMTDGAHNDVGMRGRSSEEGEGSMTTPKPGDIVKVTLSGEVYESGTPIEGFLWVRVPGVGPIQIPTAWASVVKEVPPKEEP